MIASTSSAISDDDRRGLRRGDVVHLAEQVALDQLAELRRRDRQRQAGAEHDRARHRGDADALHAQVHLPAEEPHHVVAEREGQGKGERPPAEPGEPVAQVAEVADHRQRGDADHGGDQQPEPASRHCDSYPTDAGFREGPASLDGAEPTAVA
jgi:hypothetical protein